MTDYIDRGLKLVDDDITERDYNHATDPEYKRLRAEADRLFKRRNQLSQQSQAAYKQGDGQRAHELSEQAKQVLAQADDCNRKAAEFVFRENNEDSERDEIDLHGLYVKEAVWILQRRIASDIQNNQSHIRVIVGKGLHSANGVAKIKPAVEELCRESNLKVHVDPKNSGVLVIDLSGSTSAQVPSTWTPITQQPYQGHAQPQYQQPQYNNQAQYQQHQQQQETINTGNPIVDLVIKMLCTCFSSK